MLGLAALLGTAGAVIVFVGLADLLMLSSVAQGVCVLAGFEYPDGYPDEERGPNQTFSLHPCPTTPNCLFQVDVRLPTELRRARFFQPPFEIPSHATPGEAYTELPLPGGLSCCPYTPQDCCDWYNTQTRLFCDSGDAELAAGGPGGLGGGCSNLTSTPWPCFLRELAPPPASSDFFLSQFQLDGAHLEVGSKWRSAFLVLEGSLVALAGLGLRICARPSVRAKLDACSTPLLRRLERRANGLLLVLAARLPRCLRGEAAKELLWQSEAATTLQRAWRRRLRLRRLERLSMAEAVALAMERRSSVLAYREGLQEGTCSWRSSVTSSATSEEQREQPAPGGPKGLLSKRPPPTARNRRLLLDSGSLRDFRRFVRVRVASHPWEQLRLEMVLEPGAPSLGIVAKASARSAGPPEVCRVVPCSPAETFGVRCGFLLLLIGRMEWPSFPAKEMIEELASSRRPLCLVLQAPAPAPSLREAALRPALRTEAAEVPPPPPPPPLRPPLQPPLPLQAPSPLQPPPALHPPDSVDLQPVPYRCEGRSERRFPEAARSRPKSADASSMRLQERRRMEERRDQVQEPRRKVTTLRPRHVARVRPATGDRASARAVGRIRPSSAAPTLGVQEQGPKPKIQTAVTAVQRPASAPALARRCSRGLRPSPPRRPSLPGSLH